MKTVKKNFDLLLTMLVNILLIIITITIIETNIIMVVVLLIIQAVSIVLCTITFFLRKQRNKINK